MIFYFANSADMDAAKIVDQKKDLTQKWILALPKEEISVLFVIENFSSEKW